MRLKKELLPDRWTWWRIAERSWLNPLDPEFARQYGGRWNPPDSYAFAQTSDPVVGFAGGGASFLLAIWTFWRRRKRG